MTKSFALRMLTSITADHFPGYETYIGPDEVKYFRALERDGKVKVRKADTKTGRYADHYASLVVAA